MAKWIETRKREFVNLDHSHSIRVEAVDPRARPGDWMVCEGEDDGLVFFQGEEDDCWTVLSIIGSFLAGAIEGSLLEWDDLEERAGLNEESKS